MPNITRHTIDWYGIPLIVKGVYVPSDPSVGVYAYFEIHDVLIETEVDGADYSIPASLAKHILDDETLSEMANSALEACEESLDAAAARGAELRAEGW